MSVGFVLVLIMLANPADRAVFSTDGKKPQVFATQEACITEGRKQGLMLQAARVPAKLACVPAVIKNIDGEDTIVEEPTDQAAPEKPSTTKKDNSI